MRLYLLHLYSTANSTILNRLVHAFGAHPDWPTSVWIRVYRLLFLPGLSLPMELRRRGARILVQWAKAIPIR